MKRFSHSIHGEKRRRAFTIVECSIVVAVVGVLAAIIIPVAASMIGNAGLASDLATVRAINERIALDEDYIRTGKPVLPAELLDMQKKLDEDFGDITIHTPDCDVCYNTETGTVFLGKKVNGYMVEVDSADDLTYDPTAITAYAEAFPMETNDNIPSLLYIRALANNLWFISSYDEATQNALTSVQQIATDYAEYYEDVCESHPEKKPELDGHLDTISTTFGSRFEDTAKKASYPKYATFRFVDEDGTALYSGVYPASVTPNELRDAFAQPEKNATLEKTFAFGGWNADRADYAYADRTPYLDGKLCGEYTFTAFYSSAYIDYFVTFDNAGSITGKTYHYNDEIEFPALRTTDRTQVVTFLGWNADLQEGDRVCDIYDLMTDRSVTFTASYSTEPICYTVNFIDSQTKETVATETYDYNSYISTPDYVRPADKTYTYGKANWSVANGASVASNYNYFTQVSPTELTMDVKGIYTHKYIDYTVRFEDYDGSVLFEKTNAHYGDYVSNLIPASPARTTDADYFYSFDGWNNLPLTVEDNVVITATYATKDNPFVLAINADKTGYVITGFQNGITAEATMTETYTDGVNGELEVVAVQEGKKNSGVFTDSDVKTLVLPQTVVSIGAYAFYNATSLCSFTIPESVITIGKYAFYGCDHWSGELAIPAGVTTIPEGAFEDCTSLTGALVIGDQITLLGTSAFEGCTGFTQIYIGKNLKVVDAGCPQTRVFAGCRNVTYIYFNAADCGGVSEDDYVFGLGGYPFATKEPLPGTELVIGKDVKRIAPNMFSPYRFGTADSNDIRRMLNLTSITFEEGSVCEEIADYAFFDNINGIDVRIPASVKKLGFVAFGAGSPAIKVSGRLFFEASASDMTISGTNGLQCSYKDAFGTSTKGDIDELEYYFRGEWTDNVTVRYNGANVKTPGEYVVIADINNLAGVNQSGLPFVGWQDANGTLLSCVELDHTVAASFTATWLKTTSLTVTLRVTEKKENWYTTKYTGTVSIGFSAIVLDDSGNQLNATVSLFVNTRDSILYHKVGIWYNEAFKDITCTNGTYSYTTKTEGAWKATVVVSAQIQCGSFSKGIIYNAIETAEVKSGNSTTKVVY